MSSTRMWWLALGAGGVVVGAVAGLLGAIVAAANRVDGRAEGIWTVGKQIAGNTVSIWMLGKTNDHLAQLVDAARAIERSAASMDESLRGRAGAPREGG